MAIIYIRFFHKSEYQTVSPLTSGTEPDEKGYGYLATILQMGG